MRVQSSKSKCHDYNININITNAAAAYLTPESKETYTVIVFRLFVETYKDYA